MKIFPQTDRAQRDARYARAAATLRAQRAVTKFRADRAQRNVERENHDARYFSIR